MSNKKETSKTAFNHQAATYDHDIKGQHARSLYPFLLEKLSTLSYQSALDLGCGTGEMLRLILSQNSDKELTGIDLSEKMLEVAHQKLPDSVSLVLGDSEHLPFSDGSFDVVYCNDSFHHYPNPDNVFKEIHRVLRPDGIFLIGDCWQPLIGRTIMNFYMKYSKEGDVKIYSKKEFLSMFSHYFQNVHWQKVTSTACMVWGQKVTL